MMDPDSSQSDDALSRTETPDVCSIEEYNDVRAKQRASVLWLLSKAYMPKIPPELCEPCYRDHEGNERLKPQIVHALANAELYCLALANIYADPNYHNLNHHGIVQVLTRKGIEIEDPMDATLTETVLVQTAPIRMNAHMAVIEGLMALFIKEVLIPEKVMEVVSRFAEVNPESELPYDCEEAALLWINKCCLRMRQRIDDDFRSSPDSPDSSHLLRGNASCIALAQDLGDLSDGCCLAAVLSLYCPRHFKWKDIQLHDPISLADSVHNLQLVQRFCQEHLPQDIYCLSLEDMVYMHPSIVTNVLAFVADLMYVFEIRPPKHVFRPGVAMDDERMDVHYINGHGQSPQQNCRIKNFQKSVSPIPDLRSGYEMTRSGSWQAPQKSMSSRKISAQEDSKQDGLRSLRRTVSVNFSEVGKKNDLPTPSNENQKFHNEDEELASYFPHRQAQSQQNLLEQEDNKRTNRPAPINLMSPGQLESLSENNELSSGKWAESRDQSQKSGLQRSPSSYEIHQLSPSKQAPPRGRGYSCKRSQSDMQLSQGVIPSGAGESYPVQSVSHEHFTPRTFTREPRKLRSSYHESIHGSIDNTPSPRESASRRFSQDVGRVTMINTDNHGRNLSGSLTWRKPRDLFLQSEWNKENVEVEGNSFQNCEEPRVPDDQGGVVSFANLSRQKNNSGSAINFVYSNQERDNMHGTYKKPTRPDFLHISKSHSSSESVSPSNSSEWPKGRDGKNDQDMAVLTQMHDIKLKLEEKRKRIDHERAMLESLSKKQREKVGKAAFLQAIKGGSTPNKDDFYSKNRQFSMDDITEDLDTVRRKWLERKNDMESDNDQDIQQTMEQLNSSLNNLQMDISHLTEQQEMMQKVMKDSASPNENQGYYLHEQQGGKIPSKWAEPTDAFRNNGIYHSRSVQSMITPDLQSHVSGRGHWGQPVIPFGGYQPPPPQQQTVPMWQQRAPSVEPHMMYGQPMQMYDMPTNNTPYNQGFNMHSQQANYNSYYPPNPYYPNEPNNQFQTQYANQNFQQTNYPVMQNTFTRNSSQGFHLHRNPSQTFIHDEVDRYHNIPPENNHFELRRSESQSAYNHRVPSPLGVDTDEFGRHPKNSESQHSPPTKPVLGKTFRVSKQKGPSSPEFKQQSAPMQEDDLIENVEPPNATESEPPSNDKGFYVSFENEPRKPKPKLKPKHLKARNQQKKIDSESGRRPDSEHNEELEPGHTAPSELPNTATYRKMKPEVPARPAAKPVGFVIGSESVNADHEKELEMTRRKEMIMMMSMRRRVEQEQKKNEKQQELMYKREEDRVKKDEQEKKKMEEKLRRQLILEQYRQKKSQEEEENNGGAPRGRDENSRGSSTATRSKSRSASVTRQPRPKSGHSASSHNLNMSTASSLDSPGGMGSHTSLASTFRDDASEQGYAPSPCHSRIYPHSSPISPSSGSPTPLSFRATRSSPSDGLSDTSSTASSAWACSEYSGPKLFVKPSAKSNRGIVVNAIAAVLAGAVNSDTKRKVLEVVEKSEGKHFLILFRDAGCQFRALYSYNPETEEVVKLFGIGPRVITDKMMDRFYKYNSGSKGFTQIHTKHLTATIDAITIKNSLWQGKKMSAVPKRDFF